MSLSVEERWTESESTSFGEPEAAFRFLCNFDPDDFGEDFWDLFTDVC